MLLMRQGVLGGGCVLQMRGGKHAANEGVRGAWCCFLKGASILS